MLQKDEGVQLNQNHIRLLRELIRYGRYIAKTPLGVFEVRDSNHLVVQVIQARNVNRILDSGALIVMGTVETELGDEVRYDVTGFGKQLARGTNPRSWVVTRKRGDEKVYMRALSESGLAQGWTDDPYEAGHWTARQARSFYDDFAMIKDKTDGWIYGFEEIL